MQDPDGNVKCHFPIWTVAPPLHLTLNVVRGSTNGLVMLHRALKGKTFDCVDEMGFHNPLILHY